MEHYLNEQYSACCGVEAYDTGVHDDYVCSSCLEHCELEDAEDGK
jgi:hypothetical protein